MMRLSSVENVCRLIEQGSDPKEAALIGSRSVSDTNHSYDYHFDSSLLLLVLWKGLLECCLPNSLLR